MDGTVPREVLEAGYGPDQGHRPGVSEIQAGIRRATLRQLASRVHGTTAIHLQREVIALGRGKPQNPGRIPHRHLPAVSDGFAYHGGVPTTVLLVHVLKDLLPVPVSDVQIDVRRLVAGLGEEALEQQIQPDRIHGGDPETVTDGGIGRRLAADPLPCTRIPRRFANRTMSHMMRK